MARAPAVAELEFPPEADRLADFPHPRETATLFGQRAAETIMAQALATGRMHHAWLVAGRSGIGKATFGYRLARYVLAHPQERGADSDGPLSTSEQSIASRQVRALSHPGLLVIRRTWDGKAKRFSATIPVDEVRRIKSFLAHATGPQAWRVVIVDRADELNLNAANALLKSLEEPPPRALFVLVSDEPGRLLSTIRSRCRRIDLAPLGADDLRSAAAAALATAGLDPLAEQQWPRLLALAKGSVGRLLTLAHTEGLAVFDEAVEQVALLPKVDWPRVHALADELTASGAEQRFEQFFQVFMDLLARLIRARALSAGAPEELQLSERIIPADGLVTWAELWETVHARKVEAQVLNLDRKSLLLETFARLQAASRR